MGDFSGLPVVHAEPVLPAAQAIPIPAGGAAAGAVPAANVVIDVAAQVREIAAGGNLLTDRFGPLNFDASKRAFVQILTGAVGDLGRYLGQPHELRVLEITDYLCIKAREAEGRANPGRAFNQDQSDRAALNLLQNILIILEQLGGMNVNHEYVRDRIIRSCGIPHRAASDGWPNEVEGELDEILQQLGGVETLIRQVYENGYRQMMGGKRRRRTGKKSRRKKSRRRKSRRRKSRKKKSRKTRKNY